MKKLMIMIAAVACAVGAYADEAKKDTFDEFAENDPLTNSVAWVVGTNAEAKVILESEHKVLSIEESTSADPIQRLFNMRSQDGLSGTWTTPVAQEIPGTGLYFDSKVKFTVADSLTPEGYNADGAKIAIFAYCDDDHPESGTNLVARAGYWDGSTLVATNYILDAQIDANAWYRLTVKAIPINSGDAPEYGFVVYTNESPVAYTEAGVGLSSSDLSATAAKYNDAQQLLPSILRRNAKAGTTLTTVSFVGNGKIDDVDFTATVPEFAKDEVTVRLTYDAGVQSISTNGAEIALASVTSPFDVVLPPTATTLTIAATPKTGYAFESFTNQTINPQTTKAVKLTTFVVAAEIEGKGKYATLAAVFDAATAGDIVKLGSNYALHEDDPSVTITKDVVFDLAGKTLTKYGENPVFVVTAGSLTMTNSTVAVGVVDGQIMNTVTVGEEVDPNALRIFGGKYTVGFEGVSTILGECSIAMYDPTSEEETFVHTYDSTKFDVNKVEGYWVVTEKAAPTTYTVTVASGITNGKVETSVTNNVAEGTVVTVIATPDANYTIDTVYTNGSELAAVASVYSFAMPAENVTVSATFKAAVVARQITWEGQNIAVTNTTAGTAITTSPVELAPDTVITFYPTTGAITNVTVDGVNQDITAYTWSYTVGNADASIVVKAGKFVPNPTSGSITCDTEDQASYLATNITLHPQQYIQAPAGVTGNDATTYQSMFKANASGTTVTLALTDDAKTALSNQVNTAIKTTATAAALTDGNDKTLVTIASPVAGMFYWIEGDADVKGDYGDAGDAEQAKTGVTLQLGKPSITGGDGTKAFYKIGVDFKSPKKPE